MNFVVREARREEHAALGQLMVAAYAALEGFPTPEQQPRYYEMLTHIGRMAERPHTQLLVAVAEGELLGGVVYFSDRAQYGSGGSATQAQEASGFRLLAVSPAARGLGVGRALAQRCVALARAARQREVIIHSTRAMQVAWGMYERMGFERSPDLDFLQEALQVYGFRLGL